MYSPAAMKGRILFAVFVFMSWILPYVICQRGVCYDRTAAIRSNTAQHTRSVKDHYDCSVNIWGRWRWRRCTSYHLQYYSSRQYYTVYMSRSFCCPGYTAVRGRCTLPIQLTPRYGHLFGGTPVVVFGPYFTTSDTITCQFGDITVNATYINDEHILCVSPRLTQIGDISFIVYVVDSSGAVSRFDSTYSAVSPDRAHSVDVDTPSLMLPAISAASITWNPDQISPNPLPDNTDLKVDIALHVQQYTQSNGREWAVSWELVTHLAIDAPNEDGEARVFIPPLGLRCRLPLHDNTRSVEVGLCPVIIRVSVSANQDEGVFALPTSVGMWSGVIYMQSNFPKPDLRAVCDSWGDYEMESGATGQALLNQAIPCPPTEGAARNDRNFELERMDSLYRATSFSQKAMVFFHPGITACYRQFSPSFNGVGQQCCYRPGGSLVRGEPSGGSIDMMSPKVDYNRHLSDDVVPFIYCCKGDNEDTNCNEYYQWRPSGEETGYRLPLPACVYGDPHIITLDGLKYTFNGKGEFTLIETSDNSFTLQGRMDTILDPNENPTPGTVFTALVAREEKTNTTVQFTLQGNSVLVHVNHKIANLSGVSELIRENVTVTDNGNSSVSALFKGGAKMEIKVENGIISVMLITLPSSLKGITRGLMGNYNGNTSDDLFPKAAITPILANSSLEDIHKMFGITWILNSAAESLFVYNAEESFASFYDPSFAPLFETKFKNAVLEEKAREVCGDNENCLFDIAATNIVEIGMATMQGEESFEDLVEMTAPIVCDPPCVNGACVKNDTCSCSEGYEGDTCQTSVVSVCDTNICQNNGTCRKHVLTYTCVCPEGFIGAYCQEKEPPFHIRLLNSSPRVRGQRLIVDFIASMPIRSADCLLIGGRKTDCTSGHITYMDILPGSYILLIQAISEDGDKAALRRTVHIGDEDDFCAVHMINEGLVIDGRSVSVFFQGTEAVDSYQCRLRGLDDDSDTGFINCRSPTRYHDMETGEYRFQVLPVGCDKEKKLSVKFDII